MRFAVFHLIMALWVLWRFVLPLDLPRRFKAALALLVVVAASFSTVTVFFFGGLLSPEAPRWFLIAGNSGEAVLLFLCGLTAAREVLILFSVLAGRSGEKMHYVVQKDRRTALGIAAAAAGLAAAGVSEGVSAPEVRRHTAEIENLPPALEGFEFVQLSDLHASALLTEPWSRAVVERVNALRPKLILITGDFVDGTVERRERDVAPFADLRAECGVWGCEGNHEHYGDYEAWMRKIEALGIRVLRNAHTVLDVKNPEGKSAQLCLAGLCDPMAARFGREMPNLEKTFAGAPASREALRILMAHQPKFFPKYCAQASFALQLSGHTHGGQIWGMDEAVAIINGGFVRGFYRRSGALMYVHPGTGLWNGFPIRLGAASEIALIRLTRKQP